MESGNWLKGGVMAGILLVAAAAWRVATWATDRGAKVSQEYLDAAWTWSAVILVLCAASGVVVGLIHVFSWWRHRSTRVELSVEGTPDQLQLRMWNRGPRGFLTATARIVEWSSYIHGSRRTPYSYVLCWQPDCLAQIELGHHSTGISTVAIIDKAVGGDEVWLEFGFRLLGYEEGERNVIQEHSEDVTSLQWFWAAVELEISRAGAEAPARNTLLVGVRPYIGLVGWIAGENLPREWHSTLSDVVELVPSIYRPRL